MKDADCVDFAEALGHLKAQRQVRRDAWPADWWLGHVPACPGVPAYFAIMAPGGEAMPWTPGTEDVLADDWRYFITGMLSDYLADGQDAD